MKEKSHEGVHPGHLCDVGGCEPTKDSFLLGTVSLLSRRTDFPLLRGDFVVVGVDVVGDNPADRTPAGLWPADHGGVAATLQVP